ncbi:MAG: 4-phosphopantetheinyl transferase family protein [Desulfatitalea sp.]|nr:4'-phosphopantetheinyl transferase superfamily protein [Desulfatitalea sp.]NNJ99653.1 4-phosphopantetheinyl transferase family protein [Desulfatitalea sp.]
MDALADNGITHLNPRQIQIEKGPGGIPVLEMSPADKAYLGAVGIRNILIAKSNDAGIAIAAAVIDRRIQSSQTTCETAEVTGLGIDFMSTIHLNRHLSDCDDCVLNRMFTPGENAEALHGPDKGLDLRHLLCIFSIKEAAFKSLSPLLLKNWEPLSININALPGFRDFEALEILSDTPMIRLLHPLAQIALKDRPDGFTGSIISSWLEFIASIVVSYHKPSKLLQ